MSFKIRIVGAGAVGGYFGARLAAAGRDVTFLVRPKRAQVLQAQGLQIKSPHGDLTLQPKLTTAQTLSEPFDLIFVIQGVRFEAAVATRIVQDMWEKWVQLASLGTATCLLRGTVGEIVQFT
jgi:ketopantoate reductase